MCFPTNYNRIWATKYRRKVLVGSVEVRLEEVLTTIADEVDFQLLAARIHHGDHVHLFVSAPPKVCIPKMAGVFKCVSVKLLFDEFPQIKEQLWS